MIIGYARVSTDGQTLDAQEAALREAGAERVYSEKQSGAKTDRQQLAKAIAALAAGDTLIVTKLDRLARSTRDLLNTLDAIGKAGASFKSLGDPWCDTTTPHGELMVTILGGLATFERHLILARTSEGRQRAQQRGVRFGRKLKLTVHQQQEALARRAAGEALELRCQSLHNIQACLSDQGQTGACQTTRLAPSPRPEDHDDPIMASSNSIAEGERGNSCRWCPALTINPLTEEGSMAKWARPKLAGQTVWPLHHNRTTNKEERIRSWLGQAYHFCLFVFSA